MNTFPILKAILEAIRYKDENSLVELDKLFIEIINAVKDLENVNSEILSKEQFIKFFEECRTKEVTWLPEKEDEKEVLFDARRRDALKYFNVMELSIKGNKII